MSSGGTGKLPPFVFKGTGKLPPAIHKAGKGGDGGTPGPAATPVPAPLDDTTKNIAEWFADPGRHRNPPRWLVDRVAGDLVSYAGSKGVSLESEAVEAHVRDRLRSFAHGHGDRDPSEAQIKQFAETQIAEFSQGLKGGIKMMPVV